jgi:hypothetical protein
LLPEDCYRIQFLSAPSPRSFRTPHCFVALWRAANGAFLVTLLNHACCRLGRADFTLATGSEEFGDKPVHLGAQLRLGYLLL